MTRSSRSALAVAALALLAVLLAVPDAWANSQTLVLGLGIGEHRFSRDDKAVPAESEHPRAFRDAGLAHAYAEWYAFDHIGLGLRAVELEQSHDTDAREEALRVRAYLATLNWVFAGTEAPVRAGAMVGFGRADYEFETCAVNGPSGACGPANVRETDGTAGLFGVYVDFNAFDDSGLGFRFGFEALSTSLDDLPPDAAAGASEERPVDVSGRAIYLDVRWAF